MSVIALVSAKGAGVTTSALALALSGPRPTLLAECDAAGGSIRSGLCQGPPGGEIGLFHLAEADRRQMLPEAFEQHLRPLDDTGHRQWLPGLTDPLQAAALTRTWDPLGTLLQAMDQHMGYDVIIDAGRLVLEPGRVHPTLFPTALLHRADLVLLVVRSTLTSLASAVPVVRALQTELEQRGTGADALAVLMIREGPFHTPEVSQRLQAPVLAALPWDTATARYLTHGQDRPRKLSRTPLLRGAAHAAGPLEEWVSRRRLRLQPTPAPMPPTSALQRLGAARTEATAHG